MTKVIKFIRQKDYKYIDELGRGGFGKTVLLYDDVIEENFVCKKYSPINQSNKEEYFTNFITEIKLLHSVYHLNIVRIFNYYLYPKNLTGYILMEHIRGTEIDAYLSRKPERINEIFTQVISGFAHLEQNHILHRDIRPQNIMISDDGIVKIIDFGFGKNISEYCDFDKSISLNWPYSAPKEFENKIYNYQTEIYFVAKLFEKIIGEGEIEYFKYKQLLDAMLHRDPSKRELSFLGIEKNISKNIDLGSIFNEDEKHKYIGFADALHGLIAKIGMAAQFFANPDYVQAKLEKLYNNVMLEDVVHNKTALVACFINGLYFGKKNGQVLVNELKFFIELLKQCSKEKKNIVLANLHSRLGSIERDDDDIPY